MYLDIYLRFSSEKGSCVVGKIYCVDKFMLVVYFEARCVVKGFCAEAGFIV